MQGFRQAGGAVMPAMTAWPPVVLPVVQSGGEQALPDTLAALDDGRLSGAVLDVFAPEPLSPDSPAWSHPRVILTPHVASLPSRRERARHVADCIARLGRGEALPNLCDPK